MSYTGEGETAVGKSPAELLEAFSEKWNVSSDVADASIIDTYDEKVMRHDHRELHAEESVEENTTLPRSSYERAVEDRTPLDERYGDPPNWEDGTVEFIEHGQPVETCETCRGTGRTTCDRCNGDGQHQCPTCNGSQQVKCDDCYGTGTVDCSRCHGSGTITEGGEEVQCPNCAGVGEQQCSRCNGSGKHTCTECGGTGIVTCENCNGTGEVTCSVCEGDGETVEATMGSVSFTYSEEREYGTQRVPTQFVPSAGGEKVRTRTPTRENIPETLGGEGTFREEVTTFMLPATAVQYEHDGTEYEFYAINDKLRAKSFPKSGKRKLVTYAGVALVVAGILGALYYFGYLPV